MKKLSTKKKLVLAGLLSVAVLLMGGGYWWYINTGDSGSVAASTQASDSVNVDNGDEDIDWNSLPTTSVTLTSDTLTITEAGTYILTGSTNAGVTVNSDGNVRLLLSGATIKSTTGAAIYVEQAETAVIELAAGSPGEHLTQII